MSIEMWRAEHDDGVTKSKMQAQVFDELGWEPELVAAAIRVGVDDATVTLSGTVPSYPERVAAERAARRVRGVQAVRNEILVALPPADERSDAELARAVRTALGDDVEARRGVVVVTVSDGRVELAGDVGCDAERRAAEQAAERLVGVKGLVNRIVVRPAAAPGDLRARLEGELRHRWRGARIDVDVRDGTAVLSGHVHSLAERDEAERVAWDTPGVAGVQNDLRVEA